MEPNKDKMKYWKVGLEASEGTPEAVITVSDLNVVEYIRNVPRGWHNAHVQHMMMQACGYFGLRFLKYYGSLIDATRTGDEGIGGFPLGYGPYPEAGSHSIETLADIRVFGKHKLTELFLWLVRTERMTVHNSPLAQYIRRTAQGFVKFDVGMVYPEVIEYMP